MKDGRKFENSNWVKSWKERKRKCSGRKRGEWKPKDIDTEAWRKEKIS